MKELVQLSKTVDVNASIAIKAFKMDYIYLHEDGFTVHFDPNVVPPMRTKYADMDPATALAIQSTFSAIGGLAAESLTSKEETSEVAGDVLPAPVDVVE